MFKGVQVCEGEVEGVVTFKSKAELDAYSKGFNEGADKYGAGGAFVATPDVLDELDPVEDVKIIAAVQKHCL